MVLPDYFCTFCLFLSFFLTLCGLDCPLKTRLVEVRLKVFIVLLLVLRVWLFMMNTRWSLHCYFAVSVGPARPRSSLSFSHIHLELATLAWFFTQMEMCAVTWPSPLTICCPISHKQPAGPANRPVTLTVGTITDGPSLKRGGGGQGWRRRRSSGWWWATAPSGVCGCTHKHKWGVCISTEFGVSWDYCGFDTLP